MLVYLNLSVMFGNYLQQTTSADDIFRCIFLGALRVKSCSKILNALLFLFSNKCLVFRAGIYKMLVLGGIANSGDSDQTAHLEAV